MKQGKQGRAFPPQDYSALITPEQARTLRARRRGTQSPAPVDWAKLPPEWRNPPRWAVGNPDALNRWNQERAALLEQWERERPRLLDQWNQGADAARALWEQARREFAERWKTQPANNGNTTPR